MSTANVTPARAGRAATADLADLLLRSTRRRLVQVSKSRIGCRSSASFAKSINASLSWSYNEHSFSHLLHWLKRFSHSFTNFWFSSANFFNA
ncbi:hypothetical protein Vadar_014391 [Vaccinium darrowii]|uniref:Uncharacterized protein n=1 Tax=Vaccinium darrowii TaxID=229202 RepID=A0ACB7YMT0_9ERIC|nr:hypothetical protein Vadar_014391 [Vaccinium darrowii]